MKIEIRIHYQKEDKEFLGDYSSVEVFENDGDYKLIASFGDAYHDHGEEKAEFFVLGILWALKPIYGNIEVVYSQVADSDY